MSSVLSPHSARLTESHGGDACASSDAQRTSSEWSLASKTPAKIGSELFFWSLRGPSCRLRRSGPLAGPFVGEKETESAEIERRLRVSGFDQRLGVLHIHQARPGSA